MSQNWFDISISSLPMIKFLDDLEQKILSPLSCVKEHGTKWVLEFDLPLVEKKDVNVFLDENETIVVEAKLREKFIDSKGSQRFEYEYFKKSIRLPTNVDTKNISARFSNGRLTITLPKLFKGSRIKIQ